MNVVLMLHQRRAGWASVRATLFKYIMFAGVPLPTHGLFAVKTQVVHSTYAFESHKNTDNIIQRLVRPLAVSVKNTSEVTFFNLHVY